MVSPNAVDLDAFDPDRADGAAVRKRHGLEGKTVIGFAGCFAKWHGIEPLVRLIDAEPIPRMRQNGWTQCRLRTRDCARL